MKIKMDFVSNSSSTSFVYISREMLTERSFLSAIGVLPESPLYSFFRGMYEMLDQSLKMGTRYVDRADVEDITSSHSFTPEVLDQMRNAIDRGEIVITSTLSSDGGLAEGLLCVEIFQIESPEFFINAYDNYW